MNNKKIKKEICDKCHKPSESLYSGIPFQIWYCEKCYVQLPENKIELIKEIESNLERHYNGLGN